MKLTSRERGFIVAGILIIVAVGIVYGILSVIPYGRGLSQTVDQKRKLLLKQRETLSREEVYRKRVEQYGKHLEQDMSRLLSGDNPNVAGAELQTILKEFADRSGVEITQKNTLPDKKIQDMLTKISVRIETNCDLDQLIQFLAAIENHEKLLRIEEFLITSFPIQKRYEIRPSLTVVGYISSRGAKPKEKPATGM